MWVSIPFSGKEKPKQKLCVELVLPPGFSQPFSFLSQEMTSEEQEIIKDLEKCDFREIHKYFVEKNEARKALPKEEKQVGTGSYGMFWVQFWEFFLFLIVFPGVVP